MSRNMCMSVDINQYVISTCIKHKSVGWNINEAKPNTWFNIYMNYTLYNNLKSNESARLTDNEPIGVT